MSSTVNRRNAIKKLAASAVALSAAPIAGATLRDEDHPPEPAREFRGVWVATVANIDWPSKPGLPVAQQQAELIAIMDRAAALRLNAVIFQVRPACDAYYESKIEPWSEYLTGVQGRAPSPFYDPLQLAVTEAHKRGLELHAWFNPYRARHLDAKSPISYNHISRTHPEMVRTYGRSLWLDPGSEAVQDYSVRVIMDVVKRYDIDGVHIDDYFYPYKVTDSRNQIVPFPDDVTWQEYLKSGGSESRDDWRRESVNTLIERLHKAIKKEKSWVKFGISPFGIWRPGYPQQIKGYDAYDQLYADSRKWLREGWCDYFTPQLYWPVKQTAQSYPVLLKWWVEQDSKKRHIWPGNYTGRVGDGSKNAWTKDEIIQQILTTRNQTGATGNVHYSMKSLLNNRGGVAEALVSNVYGQSALVPASPWLKEHASGKPKLDLTQIASTGKTRLSWKGSPKDPAWLWVVQTKIGKTWNTRILPYHVENLTFEAGSQEARAAMFAVSHVDRYGNKSAPATIDADSAP